MEKIWCLPFLKKRELDNFYVKPTRKHWQFLNQKQSDYKQSRYTGAIENHPALRKRALLYIHDLKLAGKEAGIEAREAKQHKKTLEHRVISVIMIGSFVFSALLSSNLTGNVVGLSQTSSSWIGAILFIIGLIGLFVILGKSNFIEKGRVKKKF